MPAHTTYQATFRGMNGKGGMHNSIESSRQENYHAQIIATNLINTSTERGYNVRLNALADLHVGTGHESIGAVDQTKKATQSLEFCVGGEMHVEMRRAKIKSWSLNKHL